MVSVKHELHWEDVGERVLYAALDDKAWELAEQIFGYRKESSFYIYHDGKLAAYYSQPDSEREAERGHAFYTDPQNVARIIERKKEIAARVNQFGNARTSLDVDSLSPSVLRDKSLEALSLYHEALSVHYLTQPQFFVTFEKYGPGKHRESLDALGHARLAHTRPAWTTAMQFARMFLTHYARNIGYSLEDLESALPEELARNTLDLSLLKQRSIKFVLVSDRHNHRVLTGSQVDNYIRKYENYRSLNHVKGLSASKGKIEGRAFVVKNENLDLKKLPLGMEKGDILIIQNAWPEFAPYYALAKGIVTNEGGITSHGVVVAREFNVPCIVGTKIATKLFHTGDTVEVDADQGLVRLIKGLNQ